jgi:hypothetical protein
MQAIGLRSGRQLCQIGPGNLSASPSGIEKRAIRLARKKKAEQEYKDWLKQQANQAATNGQAEAERIKAKIPLPPAESEGKFEVRFAQQLIEIMTGKPTTGKPTLIKMPDTDFEPIALVLSSTLQFYYRTIPNHCPCKGWFYSWRGSEWGNADIVPRHSQNRPPRTTLRSRGLRLRKRQSHSLKR